MFATMMERLTEGLWFERESASSSVAGIVRLRSRRPGQEIEPVLRFRRGPMNGRRVHVDLVLLGGDRSVEVSFHPAATVDLVQGHAQRRGHDGNGWLGALLAEVLADAAKWGSWVPVDARGAAPFAVLGGVSHPLLGAAYDAGAAPAAEVPRWASAALAESSMAACAARLFGAATVTRSVVRALARFLVRPVPDWWQLAACCAGAAVLSADEVVTGLSARPAEPVVDVPRLPDAGDVAVLRAGFVRIERTRAKRLLVDAVQAGAASTSRLARVLRALVDVEDELRWPPPVRFADLEAVCLRSAALDPAPRRATSPRAGPDWSVPTPRSPSPIGPAPWITSCSVTSSWFCPGRRRSCSPGDACSRTASATSAPRSWRGDRRSSASVSGAGSSPPSSCGPTSGRSCSSSAAATASHPLRSRAPCSPTSRHGDW